MIQARVFARDGHLPLATHPRCLMLLSAEPFVDFAWCGRYSGYRGKYRIHENEVVVQRFRELAEAHMFSKTCLRGSVLALVAMLLLSRQPAHAQDKMRHWPQFRGPTGQGTSEATGLPTTWSETENLVWKTELPGPGTSTPIILGSRIYLTCYSGYNVPGLSGGEMEQLKLHLLCLNRETGKIIGSKEITPSLPEQDKIRDNHGYASSTPATDGERLFVFFGKTGVFAFDLVGKQLWQADVGSGLNSWGSAASPVLYEKLVIVNASVESESLIALDQETGKEVWRVKGIRESWNTPILAKAPDGSTELVIAIAGKLLGIDPTSGETLWTAKTDIGWYMVPSLVAEDGVVYAIGGRSGIASLAVKLGGRGEVTDTHRLWVGKKGSNVSSPVLHAGRLYFMSDSQGIAYCLDPKTGEAIYEQRVDRADQIYASPVVANGKIYYLGRSGRMFVVEATPEYKLLARNDFPGRSTFNASPAVAGNQLFVRSDHFLYCLGTP